MTTKNEHLPTSLRAMAEDKTDGITKSTTFRVDPNLITFEKGFNLREDNEDLAAHVERLYEAMKAGAFIPPVDVQVDDKGKIVARDGHCRTKAARKLRKEMPEYTLECRQLRGNEVDAVIHMLGTGSGQKPLTPLEQGKGYLRLVKMGLKPADIAAKLGVSRVTIDNGLTLAEAPVEVQQMIAAGEVSSTTAREAVKQGKEGIAALKAEVEKARKDPAPAKNKDGKASKKKKVTAKKLKGTAADKKTKPKKDKAKKDKEEETPAASNGEIMVKLSKADAQAVASFLRSNAPTDDKQLLEFAAALEMLLM